MKRDIKNFEFSELKKEMAALREPSYRAQQVFYWLYKKGVTAFSGMKNIGGVLKEKLDKNFFVSALDLCEELKARDKTEKFLFRLHDGKFIESVLIHAEKRVTLCISTQVGCRFSCRFCASGLKGFVRNLEPAEMVSQILFVEHNLGKEITNYVFMGMGEPLDNCENLVKAIRIMNDPEGLNIGARRITVSTCGLVPEIKKLKEFKLQINLSVSLHAATDELRNELVPINRKYGLAQLTRACADYAKETGRVITLEYVLLGGKNDSSQDASRLASLAKGLKAKVNVIPYSPLAGLAFKAPSGESIQLFMKTLLERGVNATLRMSKGLDIQAACGQLAGRR